VPIVLKSGSLNLLESSGPVKTCNGTALPLPIMMYILTGSFCYCSYISDAQQIPQNSSLLQDKYAASAECNRGHLFISLCPTVGNISTFLMVLEIEQVMNTRNENTVQDMGQTVHF
jgi:hypothetical protein